MDEDEKEEEDEDKPSREALQVSTSSMYASTSPKFLLQAQARRTLSRQVLAWPEACHARHNHHIRKWCAGTPAPLAIWRYVHDARAEI